MVATVKREPYRRYSPPERPASPVGGSAVIRRALADRAVRWYAGLLARRALTAATYGNRDGARKLTVRAVRRGPVAVGRLVAVWTEAVLGAAANRDDDMWEAVVAAVPAKDLHEYLADLLRMASDAVVARDDVFWP